MSLNLGYLSGCCGIQEIRYLSHQKTAKESMLAFCNKLWSRQDYDYKTGRYVVVPYKTRKVDAHYIFTGVMGYVRKQGDPPKYGEEFAAFIKKNGLGKVIASGISPNRVNHPNHKLQAWIWTPAPGKLKDWYNKETKGEGIVQPAS